MIAEVGKGGAAEKAGLGAADVLERWQSQDGHRGVFPDAFALAEVETEYGPRGPLTLRGRRGQAAMSWTLGPLEWRIKLEPRAEAKEAPAAAERLRQEGRLREACWLLVQSGAFEPARAIAGDLRDARLEAAAWEAEGTRALAKNELARAAKAYAEALRIRSALARGEESLLVALGRSRVAFVAFQQGDVDAAGTEWTAARFVRERLAPRSLTLASCLNGLGMVESTRGRYDAAEALYNQSLAIREDLNPESIEIARTLANLSNDARHRGDLALSDQYARRSMAVLERIAPDTRDLANSMVAVGIVAGLRGDIDTLETYHRRALSLLERTDRGGSALAACLNNLGEALIKKGRHDQAAPYFDRALKMYETLAPESDRTATLLVNVAVVAAATGDRARARDLLERSLAIHRRLAPQGLRTAETLAALADLSLAEKDLRAARRLHEEALAIRQRVAPASAPEALSHHALARVWKARGRAKETVDSLLAAVSALESQQGRLGDPGQVRATFSQLHGRIFDDTVAALVETRQPAAAFHLLERSRARSFLAMLAERRLRFSADDPPADVVEEQRRIDSAYDAAQAALARLQPGRDDAKIDRHLTELEDLRHRRRQASAAIRRASPKLASLQEPAPLDLGGARAALDPGTLLLSYSVGAERTLLFAVLAGDQPGHASALHLSVVPVTGEALRQRVELLRGLIDRGRTQREPEEALLAQARHLYKDLLGGVAPSLAVARRLLIIADGPLHALPFSVLVDGDGRHLAERLPLHAAPSVTTYAELRRAPRPAAADSVVAFGDAVYTRRENETAPSPHGWVLARAGHLAPLPATRAELDAIAAAYPTAVRYLGAHATEARAKSVGRGTRLIHFACHGLLDRRFPLDSALALSAPIGAEHATADNGLLQAWEVFETVRLDADLVTLSGCDTGLGREMGGEGLIGLSRAFQYAGARSVMASLWSVSDRSTAMLMGAFYRNLRQGMSKDEALRAAQIDMLRRPDTAHPFHWAAFQISGLWN